MHACRNPRNGASLTNSVDVTAHSISVFQENEPPNNINGIVTPKMILALQNRLFKWMN